MGKEGRGGVSAASLVEMLVIVEQAEVANRAKKSFGTPARNILLNTDASSASEIFSPRLALIRSELFLDLAEKMLK